MIEIQNNIKPPRPRAVGDKRVISAIDKYQKLYRLVYGREPLINYDVPWVQIEGQTSRVKLSRLREMIKQLGRRIE